MVGGVVLVNIPNNFALIRLLRLTDFPGGKESTQGQQRKAEF